VVVIIGSGEDWAMRSGFSVGWHYLHATAMVQLNWRSVG
jgi:hypothetical protein